MEIGELWWLVAVSVSCSAQASSRPTVNARCIDAIEGLALFTGPNTCSAPSS